MVLLRLYRQIDWMAARNYHRYIISEIRHQKTGIFTKYLANIDTVYSNLLLEIRQALR